MERCNLISRLGSAHVNAPRNVGMGEIAVVKGHEKLGCTGLGSCLALVAHDPTTGVSAMVHIMLPRPWGSDVDAPPGKYASVAVPHLAEALFDSGADIEAVKCVMVGGAQLIPSIDGEGRLPQLGCRNIEETKLALSSFGLVLVAEETGGSLGRSVQFCAASGDVLVRSTATGLRAICNLKKAQ